MCYIVLQGLKKGGILIGDTTSIRLTEEDKARIDKIIKIIYDETQIVVTSSEIIRLGIRKLEKEYSEKQLFAKSSFNEMLIDRIKSNIMKIYSLKLSLIEKSNLLDSKGGNHEQSKHKQKSR